MTEETKRSSNSRMDTESVRMLQQAWDNIRKEQEEGYDTEDTDGVEGFDITSADVFSLAMNGWIQ